MIFSTENKQPDIDKLIYEIGKDASNTVIKFLDEFALFKEQINRQACEIQELQVKNSTLVLLA